MRLLAARDLTMILEDGAFRWLSHMLALLGERSLTLMGGYRLVVGLRVVNRTRDLTRYEIGLILSLKHIVFAFHNVLEILRRTYLWHLELLGSGYNLGLLATLATLLRSKILRNIFLQDLHG